MHEFAVKIGQNPAYLCRDDIIIFNNERMHGIKEPDTVLCGKTNMSRPDEDEDVKMSVTDRERTSPGLLVLVLTILAASCLAPAGIAGSQTGPAAAPGATAAPPASHLAAIRLVERADTAMLAGDRVAIEDVAAEWQRLAIRPLESTGDTGAQDPVMAALASPVTALQPPNRGTVPGPAVRHADVGATGLESLSLSFYAGEPAQLTLKSHDGRAVTLDVFDADARRVCSVTSLDHPVTCRFIPVWTEIYRIDLRNSDPEPARYTLVSN